MSCKIHQFTHYKIEEKDITMEVSSYKVFISLLSFITVFMSFLAPFSKTCYLKTAVIHEFYNAHTVQVLNQSHEHKTHRLMIKTSH